MFTNVARFGAFFVLGFGVALLPGAASAQTLSVAPTSLSAQSSTGQDAPSQTVTIRNTGGKALKWSVGASTAPWLIVSPGRGTQGGNLVLTLRTASLPPGSYQASFGIASNGGSANVDVQLSVAAAVAPPVPPAPTLTVSCPANVSLASPDGKSVAVNYSATTSGGVAPVSVTGNPASGSAFAVGTTSVAVTAQSSDGQTARCSFTVNVTYTAPVPPPPTSTTAVGPQSTITCPAGAVDIGPGNNTIQSFVNVYPGATTFCLRAGVHYLTSAITPKTGNVFIGEYGAILDGSGWVTSDQDQGAFRAHNQDIDYVTIRNLVIRNMPQRGIHAFYYMSDHWTIEYNEIASNKTAGILFPGYSTLRNNYIHHNPAGGYLGTYASYTTLDGNEIAYNGREQKIGESVGVTVRNNFVHHNSGDGIWFDSNNSGTLIEGNRVEDNGASGVFYEIGTDVIVRNNTVRRSGNVAIFISTSKNAQVYNNTLENNFRGILYFVNCNSVGGGTIGFDLANNTAHDNTVIVGTQTDAFANGIGYISCTSTQVAPYLNGSKNLTFTHNTYDVPSPTTGMYWLWDRMKYWNEWQALGQDVTGVSQ